MFNLTNKIVVVTGANGVLGSAMCHYLAQNKAKVIVLGRNKEKIEKVANEINANSGFAYAVMANITNEKELELACIEINNNFEKIDILVNVAGGNMPGAVIMPNQIFEEASADDLQKVMELNYMGTVLPTKILMPLLRNSSSASIINISSMAASRPLTRVMGYASSKAAIDNFTKWLAVELATKSNNKIRVNAIAPGFFLTEQNKNLLTNPDGTLTDRGNQIISHTPFKRFGNPDDLFGALHWLATDASKFVTGTIVAVDGGFNAYSGV